MVEDTSNPTDVRFLHVLEAADAGVPVGSTTLVESASGTLFAGAAAASMVVMFPVVPSAAFTGRASSRPARRLLRAHRRPSPWAPATRVRTQPAAGGTLVTVAPGGSLLADAGGVIVVGASSPPPPSCTFALSAPSASFAAAGAHRQRRGSVGTAGAGCSWTAQSGAAWLTVTGGASGTAAGSVAYAVAASTATTARTGTLTIGGQTFTVSQAAASSTTGPCAVTLPVKTASFSASGGTGTLTVDAPAGCAWQASSGAGWIWESQPVSGTGNGTVTYTIIANTGAARTGVITVGGQTFTITQSGTSTTTGPCAVTLPVKTASFPSIGGTGTLAIDAPAGCAWQASSGAGWIWESQPVNGTGTGTLGYTVIANTGAARTGVITVGGQTFTVSQAGH